MTWAKDVWPSERARLMSGHMMPIEREAAEATVEILELNSWLKDDVKCEGRHLEGQPACTFEVTHLYTSCYPTPGSERRVCTATAAYVYTRLAFGGRCGDCGEPKEAHWRIRPI